MFTLGNRFYVGEPELDTVTGQRFPGCITIWDKSVLGEQKGNAGLYYFNAVDKSHFTTFVATTNGFILINVYAPISNDVSAFNYAMYLDLIKGHFQQFLQQQQINTVIDPLKVLVVGDFNDRFGGLLTNEVDSSIVIQTRIKIRVKADGVLKLADNVTLSFTGAAPKSCCANWDSSCPQKTPLIAAFAYDPAQPFDENTKKPISKM